MTRLVGFTDAAVTKLPAPAEGRAVYRDRRVPGLYLAVTANGVKSWSVVKWFNGRTQRITIGRFPTISVTAARRLAADVLVNMAAGNDPAAERREVRNETTFEQLWETYYAKHALPHKKSHAEDKRQYERHLEPWAGWPLSRVHQGDVRELHNRIGKDAPYQANRVLALVSAIFSFATSEGYQGPNPARGVKRFKEQSRDRFLDGDELRRFFKALSEEPDPLWRDFFTVALLTGARRSNVEGMAWADIDLGRGIWRIPASESKSGEPLLCVLAPAAVEVLQRRAATIKDLIVRDGGTTTDDTYVFPSWGVTGHVTEPKKAWAGILKRAGLADLHIHDLRRTLGSWQAAAGASLSIIGRSLGHKNIATTAIYARLNMDPIRESVNTATANMMQAAGGAVKALPAPDKIKES